MPLFHRLKHVLFKHLVELRWYAIVYSTLLYVGTSWLLLHFFGEHQLTQPGTFFYWLLVTASTVGYGDYSPQTTGGRWAVALFIIPIGLSLFAVLIGHLATFFAEQWRKGVKGLKQLEVENHILIIGWNGSRTLRLLKLILREQAFRSEPSPVVLCVTEDIENPLPEQIQFARVASYKDDSEMSRTNVDKAECIILDNAEDDTTLTSALYCYSRNPKAHTIAYFNDENLVPLLQKHCPNIECTPSVAVEMMAKSAVDPGSSSLHQQLLDVDEGMTQYSIIYPANEASRPVEAFFTAFKKHYEATLIGVANKPGVDIKLNPDLDFMVDPGAVLFYIADERVNHFDWSLCHV